MPDTAFLAVLVYHLCGSQSYRIHDVRMLHIRVPYNEYIWPIKYPKCIPLRLGTRVCTNTRGSVAGRWGQTKHCARFPYLGYLSSTPNSELQVFYVLRSLLPRPSTLMLPNLPALSFYSSYLSLSSSHAKVPRP
ncbi:hypothetical protein F4820DRAFT_238963 [Hypoxylon rubiginosum]|uniref:Uncharacterized protein n=1 Tax=Hypoxylon rubiginosum TaxID=110542 RepID=A0ACB9Z4Y1_9PEZI|nr:hypothetical protein F4820DRAFT_238963 [Hypoxylon rubiginosum]